MPEPGPNETPPRPAVAADALAAGLRTLTDEGTLSPDQATRVAAVLRAAGARAPPKGQAREGVSPALVEIAAYAGGALLLGGATTIVWYLWGQFTRPGRIGLSLLVAVALIVAAVVVGVERRRPTGSPVRARLASTLAALGTGAAVLAGDAIIHDTQRLLVIGITGLLVATPLFALLRGTPLLFAVWLAGLLTVYGVAEQLTSAGRGLWWAGDATDLWAWGVMPACYGGVWLALGVVPRLPAAFARHQNAAGLLGGLAGLFGSEYAAVENGAVGLVLGVLVVVACFAGFAWQRHWGFATAGVLCALIVPTTALEELFHDPLAAAAGLLIVGAVLLGAGLVAVLRRRHHTAEPQP